MEWLNYHHLLYFWTVMHEGSVTAAATKLRLSPSTVSTQVGNLEETFGGKLFRRVGRDLEPTDLGHLIFRYANDIFSLGREMMDTVRGRTSMGPLPLKTGIVNVLPKLIACKLLEPALSLPERVHLICHEDKEERLLAELAMHNLDLVLSDSPVRKGLSIKVYKHLLGEFGQNGYGIFAVPSVIEKEVQRQYDVEIVGRTDAVRERFYAISYERIIKHPAITAITETARRELFVNQKGSKKTR